MSALGIERLSVFGMSPVDFARLAAELGVDCIGIGLVPTPGYNPHSYPAWSLREDKGLRRELVAVLGDLGLGLSIVEGFALVPGQDVGGYGRDLDLVAELGCGRIATVSLDKDLARTIDGYGVLADMAAERGLLMSAEMGSLGPIARVEAALELVRGVGRDNFSLLLDSMHFFRLGNSLEDLAAIDPTLIGYAQLCDAPLAPRYDTYMEEAMYERMVPGEGELPLEAFVTAMPRDIVISMEIPRRALADAGVGPRERLSPCVAAAREILARRG